MPSSADARLRDDIHLLGDLLGQTLRTQEGEELFAMVERVRSLAKSARAGESGDFDALAELLASRPTEEALPVARAFAHFLNLANIAEQHHRTRRAREYQRDPAAQAPPWSCEEVFVRLRSEGVSAERLFEAVTSLRIELVLTAHPTEVVRRTLLQKYSRIAGLLAKRDDVATGDVNGNGSRAERAIIDALRREITAAWETDEVRHERPTPIEEVKGGLFIFEQTLWDAVPDYLRNLDGALREHCARGLPLDAAPVQFGSWIGGDRDGNPNVTAEVTGQACLLSRWMAADLYLREIDALRSELSMSSGSDELRAAIREGDGRSPSQANAGPTPTPSVAEKNRAREPYRLLLRRVGERLTTTRDSVEKALERNGGWREWPGSLSVYANREQLLEPLLVCWRSLHETGNGIIAEGRLLDIIRRVSCFGVTLVRLDVRQDSARHRQLVDVLDVNAASRASSHAGDPQNPTMSEEAQADLDTFHAIRDIHPQSLGAYVITMTKSAEDVLAVARLQDLVRDANHSSANEEHHAGTGPHLRIVPLFETLADLQNAADTMARLLANPEYLNRIQGRQEVMIGYSDSAKDAGRFAASWELFKAQERIVEVCREAGVELTLFHGRGGSVGRGGGPAYVAIRSQPPGSVNGRLRVTVQGEMIQAEFGMTGIALRTLEIYTTATLDATLDPCGTPQPEWRELMERMATAGARSYRKVVYETPEFLDYFRAATPEVELGAVNIGSRPSRRGGAKRGVDSLRAIPWQFAWTQNRLLLPSWLGMDAAIEAIGVPDSEALRDESLPWRTLMEWPFFESTIELLEMVLAKAEVGIAGYYDRVLVPEELKPVGEDLRTRLQRTVELVRTVTGRELLETNRVLRHSIEVRNPYVDPINVVQAEILRRLRASGDPSLLDAFVVTVNGIAAGMRNTG